MKKINLKKFDTLLYITVVLFSIFYVITLRSSLKGGFIAGADWNSPATKQQYSRALEMFSSTWSDGLYLGFRNSTHTNLWFIMFTIALSHIITDLSLTPIVLIVLIQLFAFLTTYHFLKDLNISRLSALLGGIFLATSPIFFNYLLMGWIYVLVDFSLLNLSLLFIRSGLTSKKTSHILLAGVFFGMAFVQSQAILWIPLVVVSHILFGNFKAVCLKRKVLAIVLFLLTGVVLNAPTVLALVALPNNTLFNNGILKSGVSIGTSVNATPINLIRLLGSGYNSQYEVSQEGVVFAFASFIVTLLIITLLITRRKYEDGTVKGFFLLFFIPVFAYIIGGNRELMSKIPGAVIFRDTARFSFVSTYASAVLLGVFFDCLKTLNRKVKAGIYTLVTVWIGVMVLPWVNGNLVDQPNKIGPDVRLRSLKYPEDYFKNEEKLSGEMKAYRVLYLPIGVLDINANQLFHGPYREIQDVFAVYSPLPGTLGVNDRYLGNTEVFIKALTKEIRNENNPNLYPYLISTSTRFIVLRTTVKFPNRDIVTKYLDGLVSENKATLYYNGKDIRTYEILNPYPLIYSPDKILEVDTNNINMTLFDNTENKLALADTIPTREYAEKVDIKFTKINATKYKIEIKNAGDMVPLVFTDSYDSYWQITKSDETLLETLLPKSLEKYYSHFVVNSYANGWIIETKRLCTHETFCTKSSDGHYSLNFTVAYLPQYLLKVGLLLGAVTLTVAGLLISRRDRERTATIEPF